MSDFEIVKRKHNHRNNNVSMSPKKITKEYTNGAVTIVWQSEKFIYSANCVKDISLSFEN